MSAPEDPELAAAFVEAAILLGGLRRLLERRGLASQQERANAIHVQLLDLAGDTVHAVTASSPKRDDD